MCTKPGIQQPQRLLGNTFRFQLWVDCWLGLYGFVCVSVCVCVCVNGGYLVVVCLRLVWSSWGSVGRIGAVGYVGGSIAGSI